MVQQALNRHSAIAIPPETKMFFSFFGHSRKQQVRHLQRLNADLNVELSAPERRIVSVEEGRSFYERMAESYLERLPKRDVAYFGEKTPEHTGHLPRIRAMFPEAKIIVLYRDGRDVASSLSRMPWMTTSLYANFVIWLYYHGIVQRLQESDNNNLFFARYEDIVADPQRELGRMLRFLDLPDESVVAEGCGNDEGIPAREIAWKERALEKINRERVGVFRDELNVEQIEILERLGKQALSSLGYPLLTDGERPLPPTFFVKLAYDLSRFALRVPWRTLAREALANLAPRRRPVAALPAFDFHLCKPGLPA